MATFGDPRLPERFWSKIAVDAGGCWVWQNGLNSGYGAYHVTGEGMRLAHRVAYEHLVGPVDLAIGPVFDHLCRNTRCCNPDHLEPVSYAVNSQRGETGLARGAQLRARTHCPKGHEYTPENTEYRPRGARRCRACARAYSLEYQRRRRLGAERQGVPGLPGGVGAAGPADS